MVNVKKKAVLLPIMQNINCSPQISKVSQMKRVIIMLLAVSVCVATAQNKRVATKTADNVCCPNQENSPHISCNYSGWFFSRFETSTEFETKSENGNDARLWQFDCKAEPLDNVDYKSSFTRYGYDNEADDFDFFIREFADSLGQKAVAVEYGSTKFAVIRPNVRMSRLMMLDEQNEFSRFASADELNLRLKYKQSSGMYVYEIFVLGELVGIKYYSERNRQEYTLFFD